MSSNDKFQIKGYCASPLIETSVFLYTLKRNEQGESSWEYEGHFFISEMKNIPPITRFIVGFSSRYLDGDIDPSFYEKNDGNHD